MTDNHLPKAKKHLGQHFLNDTLVLDKIVSACELSMDETVIEIGPGQGVLTDQLAKRVKQVIAVEKDRELGTLLTEKYAGSNVTVLNTDILKQDFSEFGRDVKLIGNLPYNIATPIIEKAIGHKNQFTAFYFMVQKEHALRLISGPDTKDYGSLSCFVQYHCDIKVLFHIPPQAFKPQPKIHSSFLSVRFKESPHSPKFQDTLFKLIQKGFSQRRKKLINNLKGMYNEQVLKEGLNKAGIAEKSRAENVGLKNYIELVEFLVGV